MGGPTVRFSDYRWLAARECDLFNRGVAAYNPRHAVDFTDHSVGGWLLRVGGDGAVGFDLLGWLFNRE